MLIGGGLSVSGLFNRAYSHVLQVIACFHNFQFVMSMLWYDPLRSSVSKILPAAPILRRCLTLTNQCEKRPSCPWSYLNIQNTQYTDYIPEMGFIRMSSVLISPV